MYCCVLLFVLFVVVAFGVAYVFVVDCGCCWCCVVLCCSGRCLSLLVLLLVDLSWCCLLAVVLHC